MCKIITQETKEKDSYRQIFVQETAWGIVLCGSDYDLFPLSKYISSCIIKMHHKASLCRKSKNRTLDGPDISSTPSFSFSSKHSFTFKNISRPWKEMPDVKFLLIAPNSSFKLLQKQFSIFSARLMKKKCILSFPV